VAAYVAGDRGALDELVRRHRRRVFGICLAYFGDARDAEDATQETFVALLRRASTYGGHAAFSTWLYRVATNACNDLARKRSRRPRTTGGDLERLEGTAAVGDVLANRELCVELQAALADLDPVTRDAIVWHDVAGLPYADIAERTGVAVGTVKSRIHRGHTRLASALAHLREPNRPPTPPTVQP
jgi:RNA polymerase sigma-70 factor, ECF subfamily